MKPKTNLSGDDDKDDPSDDEKLTEPMQIDDSGDEVDSDDDDGEESNNESDSNTADATATTQATATQATAILTNPEYEGKSAYEIQRLERIRRNREYLANLGLGEQNKKPMVLLTSSSSFNNNNNKHNKRKSGSKKPSISAEEAQWSSRTRDRKKAVDYSEEALKKRSLVALKEQKEREKRERKRERELQKQEKEAGAAAAIGDDYEKSNDILNHEAQEELTTTTSPSSSLIKHRRKEKSRKDRIPLFIYKEFLRLQTERKTQLKSAERNLREAERELTFLKKISFNLDKERNKLGRKSRKKESLEWKEAWSSLQNQKPVILKLYSSLRKYQYYNVNGGKRIKGNNNNIMSMMGGGGGGPMDQSEISYNVRLFQNSIGKYSMSLISLFKERETTDLRLGLKQYKSMSIISSSDTGEIVQVQQRNPSYANNNNNNNDEHDHLLNSSEDNNNNNIMSPKKLLIKISINKRTGIPLKIITPIENFSFSSVAAAAASSSVAVASTPSSEKKTMVRNVGGPISPSFANRVDRTWVETDTPYIPSPNSLYVPQEGDTVLYYPKGHSLFLKEYPDHRAKQQRLKRRIPIWEKYNLVGCHDENDDGIPTRGILCKVEHANVEFPPSKREKKGGKFQQVPILKDSTDKNNNNKLRLPLGINVTLKPLSGIPIVVQEEENTNSNNNNNSTKKEKLVMRADDCFSILIFPSELSPFLIPFVYICKQMDSISVGDCVKFPDRGTGTGKFITWNKAEVISTTTTRTSTSLLSCDEDKDNDNNNNNSNKSSSSLVVPNADVKLLQRILHGNNNNNNNNNIEATSSTDDNNPIPDDQSKRYYLNENQWPEWGGIKLRILERKNQSEVNVGIWELIRIDAISDSTLLTKKHTMNNTSNSTDTATRTPRVRNKKARLPSSVSNSASNSMVYTLTEPLRQQLEEKLVAISKKEKYNLFLKKVTKLVAPQYDNVVPRPMYMEKILKRLKLPRNSTDTSEGIGIGIGANDKSQHRNNSLSSEEEESENNGERRRCYYRSSAALLSDVSDILNNCLLYNSPSADICNVAMELWEEICHEVSLSTQKVMKQNNKKKNKKVKPNKKKGGDGGVSSSNSNNNDNKSNTSTRSVQWECYESDVAQHISNTTSDAQSGVSMVNDIVSNIVENFDEFVEDDDDGVDIEEESVNVNVSTQQQEGTKNNNPAPQSSMIDKDEEKIVKESNSNTNNNNEEEERILIKVSIGPDSLPTHISSNLYGSAPKNSHCDEDDDQLNKNQHQGNTTVATTIQHQLNKDKKTNWGWIPQCGDRVLYNSKKHSKFVHQHQNSLSEKQQRVATSRDEGWISGQIVKMRFSYPELDETAPYTFSENLPILAIYIDFDHHNNKRSSGQALYWRPTSAEEEEEYSFLRPDDNYDEFSIDHSFQLRLAACVNVIKKRCIDGVALDFVDEETILFKETDQRQESNNITLDTTTTTTMSVGESSHEGDYLMNQQILQYFGFFNPGDNQDGKDICPGFSLDLIHRRLQNGFYRHSLAVMNDLQQSFVIAGLNLMGSNTKKVIAAITSNSQPSDLIPYTKRSSKKKKTNNNNTTASPSKNKNEKKNDASVIAPKKKTNTKQSQQQQQQQSLSQDNEKRKTQMELLQKVYSILFTIVDMLPTMEILLGVVKLNTKKIQKEVGVHDDPQSQQAQHQPPEQKKQQQQQLDTDKLSLLLERAEPVINLFHKDSCNNHRTLTSSDPNPTVKIKVFSSQFSSSFLSSLFLHKDDHGDDEENESNNEPNNNKGEVMLCIEPKLYEHNNEPLARALFGIPGRRFPCVRCKAANRGIVTCRVRKGHSSKDFDLMKFTKEEGGVSSLCASMRSFLGEEEEEVDDEELAVVAADQTASIITSTDSNMKDAQNDSEIPGETSVKDDQQQETNDCEVENVEASKTAVDKQEQENKEIESSTTQQQKVADATNTKESSSSPSAPTAPPAQVVEELMDEKTLQHMIETAEYAISMAKKKISEADAEVKKPPVISEEFVKNNFPIDETDGHYALCTVCGLDGDVICCETCPNVVHPNCVGLENVPEGDWFCAQCTKRKQKQQQEEEKTEDVGSSEETDEVKMSAAEKEKEEDTLESTKNESAENKNGVADQETTSPTSDDLQAAVSSNKTTLSEALDKLRNFRFQLTGNNSSSSARASTSSKAITETAAASDSDEINIGTKILKIFGRNEYEGEVVSLPSSGNPYYKVKYNDNDCEDMSDNEINEVTSKYRERRKTLKTTLSTTKKEQDSSTSSTGRTTTPSTSPKKKRKRGRPRKSEAEKALSATPTPTTKRKRGRPRKITTDDDNNNNEEIIEEEKALSATSTTPTPTTKRKRGRPRKITTDNNNNNNNNNNSEEIIEEENTLSATSTTPTPKRKRGRPRKITTDNNNNNNNNSEEIIEEEEEKAIISATSTTPTPTIKRKRGRPPKNRSSPKEEEIIVTSSFVSPSSKRRRTPTKRYLHNEDKANNNNSNSNSKSNSKKDVVEKEAVSSVTPAKRKRGRPRKNRDTEEKKEVQEQEDKQEENEDSSPKSNLTTPVPAVVRKRGRPPKVKEKASADTEGEDQQILIEPAKNNSTSSVLTEQESTHKSETNNTPSSSSSSSKKKKKRGRPRTSSLVIDEEVSSQSSIPISTRSRRQRRRIFK